MIHIIVISLTLTLSHNILVIPYETPTGQGLYGFNKGLSLVVKSRVNNFSILLKKPWQHLWCTIWSIASSFLPINAQQMQSSITIQIRCIFCHASGISGAFWIILWPQMTPSLQMNDRTWPQVGVPNWPHKAPSHFTHLEQIGLYWAN